jgi:hypothetical protein
MNLQNIDTIYIDMDQTIADYERGVKLISGRSIEQWEKDGVWGQNKKKLKDPQFEFFLRLQPLPLLHVLKNHIGKFEILSAVGDLHSEHIAQQQRDWIDKFLGEEVVAHFVIKSHDKARFANSRSLLIDDRKKSLIPFAQNDGMILHFKNESSQVLYIEQLLEKL